MPLANTLIRCNTCLNLKLHLVTIDDEISKCDSVSSYLIISFRLPYICVHFRRLVLCKFFMNPQIALRFGCLSPYSLPHPPHPSFFLLDHSVTVFSSLFLYIHNYLFYFHFLSRSIPFPCHLLYSFCSYIDCNISYQRLNIYLHYHWILITSPRIFFLALLICLRIS